MLDSDVTPDSRLAVRFYAHEMINHYQSNIDGRPISYMADFVRIEVPGDRNTIIDTFVNEDHKRRFPLQWAQYLNEKAEGKISDDVQGTILRDWQILTPAIANELKHFKFYTVEQIASASDEQIQVLGMIAGMSPFALRDKAKAFINQAKDSSFVQLQAEELSKRDAEIDLLKKQMAELIAAQDKPKRGRPAQQEE
jgi:hypothetical protein